jgi:hypothetical protein
MALDPYVTLMCATGKSSMALDSYLTSMYPTGHPSIALNSYMTSIVISSHYVTMVDNNRERSCIAVRPVYAFLEYLLFIRLRL